MPCIWFFRIFAVSFQCIKNMKKRFIFLSLLCMLGCASTKNTDIIGNATSVEASYNVNIYDAKGDWYETGLLIESFDNKIFVKINEGRYELLNSDKEEYRYMIEIDGETFYVK